MRLLNGLDKDSEPSQTLRTASGNAYRADTFYHGNRVELKPETPTGLSAGLRQLQGYMSNMQTSIGWLVTHGGDGTFTWYQVGPR